VTHAAHLTLTITWNSPAWQKIGQELVPCVANNQNVWQWFESQGVQEHEPLIDDRSYMLIFNHTDHLLEFVLKWL
jgi:hypothetical protein